MEFLTIGLPPVTIPVSSADWDRVHVGIRKRMHDGGLMVRTRAKKWECRMSTPPMPKDQAAEVLVALESGETAASGEAITRRGFDVMTVECEVVAVVPVKDGANFQELVEFVLREV